jgi:chromosome segregation protein
MRVEKIELTGFKSFCDRTVFNLHPGITCIVGPNGCGKSNVVDAFRWVLGEQSAKSLRGGKMQEVIFAGSQTRKPKGMADVALSISGLGPPGNGGDSLTTVGRRLYRSGDSEYQMNKQACRLRDIRDVFLDTGLEIKSYSIMEQDRIAAILTAKPEERRFIIEEVAGVVKYRVRLHEAQNKLESSRNNLERINDITVEIRRQINSLDRQAKKAVRFKKLMEETRAIELRLAKDNLDSLSASLEEILTEQGSVREEDALLRASLAQVEADIESRRLGLAEAERALEATNLQLQRVEKEMAELERAVAVSENERDNLGEYAGKLGQQGEENREKLQAADARMREISSSKAALEEEINSLEARLGKEEEVLRDAEEDISAREKLLEARRGEFLGVSGELSELRAELNRGHASVEALQNREGAMAEEAGELSIYREEAAAAQKRIGEGIQELKGQALLLDKENAALANEIEEIKNRAESLRGRIGQAREELASASSRLASLEEMVSEEQAGDSLEGVNLLASVSDVIEVPREYERAVESALREIIKGYIVPSSEDVASAVLKLKEKEIGRTAFVPLEAGGRPRRNELPEGAAAWASDVVSASGGYSEALKNLLVDVAVVEDLHSAMRIARAERGNGAAFPLVTLEGEIVEPSGAVIAGRNRGLLTLKRGIRELKVETEEIERKIESLGKEAEGLAGVLREKEESLEALQKMGVDTEREISLMGLKAEGLAGDIERTDKRRSHLRAEELEIAKEKAALGGLISEKKRDAERLRERIEGINSEIGDMQARIAREKAAHEEKRSGAVRLRLSLNSRIERMNALSGEELSVERLLREMKDKEMFIKDEMTLTASRIRQAEEAAAIKRQGMKELAVSAGDLSTRISAERDVISGEAGEVMDMERGLKAKRARIEDTSHRLSELEVRRAEDKLRMENLAGNIRDTYGVELETLQTGPPEPEDQESLQELKRKIDSLGPVSLGSIEEYEELKERYAFQTAQQEDLQKSIAELEEAIGRINTTTRKRLKEAFVAMNEKFAEVFTMLFDGGRAELLLTEENDILASGIEIVAQPPGKRLQNINLLSGGEKTLSALALLFASFLLKPTPLCILDEADAALDEPNTEKFTRMLKEFSKDIQFIVVTHNRVTMETADYIYGVTMEEPGSSNMISLELTGA